MRRSKFRKADKPVDKIDPESNANNPENIEKEEPMLAYKEEVVTDGYFYAEDIYMPYLYDADGSDFFNPDKPVDEIDPESNANNPGNIEKKEPMLAYKEEVVTDGYFYAEDIYMPYVYDAHTDELDDYAALSDLVSSDEEFEKALPASKKKKVDAAGKKGIEKGVPKKTKSLMVAEKKKIATAVKKGIEKGVPKKKKALSASKKKVAAAVKKKD